MKTNVAVIYAGRTGEHEVSHRSAKSVIDAMDTEKYKVLHYVISKEGKWSPRPIVPEPGGNAGIDVVFPVLHGTFGEDGTVQGLLEMANMPYVGAGVLASAVGMDKDVQKRLFEQAGLPVVSFIVFRRSEWEANREDIATDILTQLRLPIFVKPATAGSSVGMTKVTTREQLPEAIDHAAQFGLKVIVERGVDAREIEVSVLGNDEIRASIPGEIVPHRDYYDYKAKYIERGTQLVIPAELTEKQVRTFQEYAVKAFRCIDGTGMARCDFFLEKRTNKIYVNELNTIPGFTSISMYPKLWEASGLPYSQLLDELINLALSLHKQKAKTKYTIDPPAGSGGALDA